MVNHILFIHLELDLLFIFFLFLFFPNFGLVCGFKIINTFQYYIQLLFTSKWHINTWIEYMKWDLYSNIMWYSARFGTICKILKTWKTRFYNAYNFTESKTPPWLLVEMLIFPYTLTYVMFCAIWCYLYNLKNVKNTHGGVLLIVTLLHECFSRF